MYIYNMWEWGKHIIETNRKHECAFGLVLRSQQNMYNKIKQKWTQFQRLRYTILELIFF